MVHETKFNLKISYSKHACLVQFDQHQTCKPVMVRVVSSNPTGFFKDTSMLITFKNDRNVRFVLFTKTSNMSINFGMYVHQILENLHNVCSKKDNDGILRKREEIAYYRTKFKHVTNIYLIFFNFLLAYHVVTAMEFFLNGAVLSLNSVISVNSGNLINH